MQLFVQSYTGYGAVNGVGLGWFATKDTEPRSGDDRRGPIRLGLSPDHHCLSDGRPPLPRLVTARIQNRRGVERGRNLGDHTNWHL
jgi:hypothetical protein